MIEYTELKDLIISCTKRGVPVKDIVQPILEEHIHADVQTMSDFDLSIMIRHALTEDEENNLVQTLKKESRLKRLKEIHNERHR